MKDEYILDEEDGSIVSKHNNSLLYEGDGLHGLSLRARRRLAQIHTNDKEIDWGGAHLILEREGLLRQDWILLVRVVRPIVNDHTPNVPKGYLGEYVKNEGKFVRVRFPLPLASDRSIEEWDGRRDYLFLLFKRDEIEIIQEV